MIAKLVKYEFKSTLKFMSLLWAAFLVVSVILGLSLRFAPYTVNDNFNFAGLIEVLSILLYVSLATVMVVFNIVVIIQRFYKSILSDEGYLTNTLPVKMWQIITSKGIAASCLILGTTIATLISIFIVSATNPWDVTKDLFDILVTEPISIFMLFELIVICIVSILASVYQIYTALAIGQLVNRHRILLAVGAYVGINLVMSTFGSILMVIYSIPGVTEACSNMINSWNEMAVWHVSMIALFIAGAIQVVIFHIVTERILSNKLNLL